jgi:lipopolysaccharide transport system ATP-binding protein
VRVEGVSKKFCRSLRKSLWYGVCDISSELLLRARNHRPAAETPNAAKGDATGAAHRSEDSGALRTDEFWAIKDVSFELRRGECLGLIGHNGAGKTSLLKMLNGLIKLDGGRIELRGRSGALIALGAGFNPLLTGRENVYVNGSVLGLPKSAIDSKLDAILDFAEIGEFADAPVQSYSSGMHVRLGFAVAAILIEPDVLFLDEVLAVGDIGFRYKCMALVERLMRHSAVVLVSHDMGQVQRICSSVMLLERGKIRYHGSDVALGIQRYQASMLREAESSVAGTGRAAIFNTVVFSCDHRRSNEMGLPVISYGDNMRIEFDVQFDAEIQEAIFVVNVLDQAGVPIAQCNSADQGFSLPNAGVRTRIRMDFSQLPLNPGVYRLWIIVRDRRRPEPLAVHYGVVPFQVVGHFVGYIAFQPHVRWDAAQPLD